MSEMAFDPYPVAAAKGLLVVEPGPFELFIDADSPGALTQMDTILAVLREHFPVDETRRTTSAGGNTHVYLFFPSQNLHYAPVLRCALQLALGSDPKHELLSLVSILKQSTTPPTVFFEKPSFTEEPVL